MRRVAHRLLWKRLVHSLPLSYGIWSLALLLLTFCLGCHESHMPDRPAEDAWLIGARVEDGEIVIDTKELGLAPVEVTRLPSNESEVVVIHLSPDQAHLVVATRDRARILALDTLEVIDVTWDEDPPCDIAFFHWYDAETIEATCLSDDWYALGLDGVVRRIPIPPGCEPSRRFSGGFLTRCDDGDYIIHPSGERLTRIASIPEDAERLQVIEDTVVGFTLEPRGSRFWTWTEDGPEPGFFLPPVTLSGGGFLWDTAQISPDGSTGIANDLGYDIRNGASVTLCDDEERRTTFSPIPGQLLLACPDEDFRYLNITTGSVEFIPGYSPLGVTFSRDAQRLVYQRWFDEPFIVYDRFENAVVDEWLGMNSVQWMYP